jgi:hypothetical protein
MTTLPIHAPIGRATGLARVIYILKLRSKSAASSRLPCTSALSPSGERAALTFLDDAHVALTLPVPST